MEDEIEKALSLLQPNFDSPEKGTKRQKAVWENRETDYLPLLMGNILIEKRKQ